MYPLQGVLFPFFALLIGAATLHFLTRFVPFLPYTVALMIEGMVFTFIQEAIYRGNHDHATFDSLKVRFGLLYFCYGPVVISFAFSKKLSKRNSNRFWFADQISTDLWADIDGHLLLFAFLPALLFGDAMTLNVHTFKQCFTQCLVLGKMTVELLVTVDTR